MTDVIFSFILSLVTLFGVTLPVPVEKPTEVVTTAQVLSVVDGDTIEVLLDGKQEKVRYIGIDTPEPYRDSEPACYSREATEANKNLVEGKEVTLVSDKEDADKYGRLLRYVYVNDVFVNKELILNGYGEVLTIRPNTTFAEVFDAGQTDARRIGKGLWSACKK